jgi:hypothetical protein
MYYSDYEIKFIKELETKVNYLINCFSYGKKQEVSSKIGISIKSETDKYELTKDDVARIANDFEYEFGTSYLRAMSRMIDGKSFCLKEDEILPAIRIINHHINDLVVVNIMPALYSLKESVKNDIIENYGVVEVPHYNGDILPISLVITRKEDLPFIVKTSTNTSIVELKQFEDRREVYVNPYLKMGFNKNAIAVQIIISESKFDKIDAIDSIENIFVKH